VITSATTVIYLHHVNPALINITTHFDETILVSAAIATSGTYSKKMVRGSPDIIDAPLFLMLRLLLEIPTLIQQIAWFSHRPVVATSLTQFYLL